jgi:hypothetical protein
MRSKFLVLAVAAGLAIGAAACSDDGGDDEASEEAAGATTTTEAAGLSSEVCDAYTALAGAVVDVPEGPDAGSFIESDVLPHIQVLAEQAPEELAEPAQTMLDIGTASVDDPAQFQDPAAEEAFNEFGAAVHTDCGYESLDVTAVDYDFQGVPDSVSSGTTTVALTNDGSEQHEMVLLRRADGETRSVDELLALPEDEAMEALAFTGAAFAEPGETGFLTADLEAGDYVAVCFLPVGGAEDGAPHFTRGMVTEFEVA